MAVHEARVHRVGHEVDLLRLPRPQSFEQPFELLGRRRHLLGERRRIARESNASMASTEAAWWSPWFSPATCIGIHVRITSGRVRRTSRTVSASTRPCPQSASDRTGSCPAVSWPLRNQTLVMPSEAKSAPRLDLANRAEAARTLGPVLVAARIAAACRRRRRRACPPRGSSPDTFPRACHRRDAPRRAAGRP